ncbi:hypothetical protein LXL04_023215 [Taraxacum kok-saghyz]
MGHNRVSCKNPQVIPDPKPKKKMGRPKLNPELNHWSRGTRGPKRGGQRGGGQRSVGQRSAGQSSAAESGGGQTGWASWFERGQRNATHEKAQAEYAANEGPQSEVQENAVNERPQLEVQDNQENDYMDEGDGMDISDMDEIFGGIRSMREAHYTTTEILDCMGISQEQLNDFESVIKQQQVEARANREADQARADREADQGKKKANIDAEQGKKKAKLPVKRRKPSGRIINIKLATKVVDKDGKGMTADKALELD